MKRQEKIKERIADIFDFPRDVVMDLPRLTAIGSRQIYVENHRGLIAYDEEEIRISVLNGEITVRGSKLRLRSVYTDDIYIEGNISDIAWLGGGEK